MSMMEHGYVFMLTKMLHLKLHYSVFLSRSWTDQMTLCHVKHVTCCDKSIEVYYLSLDSHWPLQNLLVHGILFWFYNLQLHFHRPRSEEQQTAIFSEKIPRNPPTLYYLQTEDTHSQKLVGEYNGPFSS